jgi:hypothetical protein
MPDTPEARPWQEIDKLLTESGWIVQSREQSSPGSYQLPDPSRLCLLRGMLRG